METLESTVSEAPVGWALLRDEVLPERPAGLHPDDPHGHCGAAVVAALGPEKPLEGNRRMDADHALSYAAYVIDRAAEEKLSYTPALSLRSSDGDVKAVGDWISEPAQRMSRGVVEISVGELIAMEGQHRIYGTRERLTKIKDTIAKVKRNIEAAKEQGSPASPISRTASPPRGKLRGALLPARDRRDPPDHVRARLDAALRRRRAELARDQGRRQDVVRPDEGRQPGRTSAHRVTPAVRREDRAVPTCPRRTGSRPTVSRRSSTPSTRASGAATPPGTSVSTNDDAIYAKAVAFLDDATKAFPSCRPSRRAHPNTRRSAGRKRRSRCSSP